MGVSGEPWEVLKYPTSIHAEVRARKGQSVWWLRHLSTLSHSPY